MGWLEDVTAWLWNNLVYSSALSTIGACWGVGGWGLLFDDDDGALMQKCFDMFSGRNVTFPVSYISSYAEES